MLKSSTLKTLNITAITLILTFAAPIIPENILFPSIVQAQTIEDRKAEADRLLQQGIQQYNFSQLQEAAQSWQEALTIYQEINDSFGIFHSVNNLGAVYDNLGEYNQAIDYLQQALTISQKIGDKSLIAKAFYNLGLLFDNLEEYNKAINYYEQALTISQEMDDFFILSYTLNNLGNAYQNTGEYNQAIDYLQQALVIAQEIDDITTVSKALNNLGNVYNKLAEYNQAIDYYQQALAVSQKINNISGVADSLNNLGEVNRNLGENNKAIDYLQQALAIYQEIGNYSGISGALNNLGIIAKNLGEYSQAIDYYQQALVIYEKTGNRSAIASTFDNLGVVYRNLGEYNKAIDYYQQALAIFQDKNNLSGISGTLNNLGFIYDILEDYNTALEYHQQALVISQKMGDQSAVSKTLIGLGNIYNNLGEYSKAIEYYQQSLVIKKEIGERAGISKALSNLGAAHANLGENEQAINSYKESLIITKEIGDKTGEANNLANIAVLEKNQGNLQNALSNIQMAIKIIEQLRSKIANPELRQSYFATVQNYYQFYTDLLMELHQQNPNQGYDKQAFNISERSKARVLLELLTEANANIKEGVDPALLQQEETLQAKLDQIETNRIKLANSPNFKPEDLQPLETERSQLLEQYQTLQDEIRRKSPNYAALKYPQPLTLEQVQQQVLDQDTVILQYSLGDEKSYLWAVTKDGFKSYILPSREEIENKAKQFFRFSTDPNAAIDEIYTTSNDLIPFILPNLKELNQKRLVIVADGFLNYLPFAALSLSNTDYQPLITQYQIVNLPSSSTIAINRNNLGNRASAPNTLAIVADPVFSPEDERLTGKTNPSLDQNRGTDDLNLLSLQRSVTTSELDLDRLPGTEQEANTIINLLEKQGKSSLGLFGFDATLEQLEQPNLSQYRIIHLATHGILNLQNPELSGVVFSLVDKQGNFENGFLRLNDIFNLKLPADLVILSACQTGSGENVKGEGIVGITRGFMYAGSPRIIASLWSVSDYSTSQLMTDFYNNYLQQNLPPSEALRQAQLKMINNTDNYDLQLPYYWAAFTLQGEWK